MFDMQIFPNEKHASCSLIQTKTIRFCKPEEKHRQMDMKYKKHSVFDAKDVTVTIKSSCDVRKMFCRTHKRTATNQQAFVFFCLTVSSSQVQVTRVKTYPYFHPRGLHPSWLAGDGHLFVIKNRTHRTFSRSKINFDSTHTVTSPALMGSDWVKNPMFSDMRHLMCHNPGSHRDCEHKEITISFFFFQIKSLSNGALQASGKTVSVEMKNRRETSDLISSFLTFLDNRSQRRAVNQKKRWHQQFAAS